MLGDLGALNVCEREMLVTWFIVEVSCRQKVGDVPRLQGDHRKFLEAC